MPLVWLYGVRCTPSLMLAIVGALAATGSVLKQVPDTAAGRAAPASIAAGSFIDLATASQVSRVNRPAERFAGRTAMFPPIVPGDFRKVTTANVVERRVPPPEPVLSRYDGAEIAGVVRQAVSVECEPRGPGEIKGGAISLAVLTGPRVPAHRVRPGLVPEEIDVPMWPQCTCGFIESPTPSSR